MKPKVCLYCLGPSSGTFSVDVELPAGIADVWLCDECGGHTEPTVQQLKDRIESMEPIILAILEANFDCYSGGPYPPDEPEKIPPMPMSNVYDFIKSAKNHR